MALVLDRNLLKDIVEPPLTLSGDTLKEDACINELSREPAIASLDSIRQHRRGQPCA